MIQLKTKVDYSNSVTMPSLCFFNIYFTRIKLIFDLLSGDDILLEFAPHEGGPHFISLTTIKVNISYIISIHNDFSVLIMHNLNRLFSI